MSDPDSTIHVLHLIGSTGLYGAERWILALMRAMDEKRFCSTLVNLADGAEQSAVVQAAERRGLSAFDFMMGGKFNPFAAKRLAGWAREQQVDIIHGHGYKSDLLGLLTARAAGCRMMTTPHGWSLEKDRKLQLFENLDRQSFRFMDMVCPLSETLYHDAVKFSVKNTRLIGNGVDLDEIRSFHPATRSNSDPFVVGYIGRLVRSKDIVTLLKAISMLSSSGRRIKLILVGDGDQFHDLVEFAETIGIKEMVDFTGFRDDTAVFLGKFDCLVLPSLSEGTPRCIMEAMALNIPVVASDIPGNRLLVTHRETGLLFPVGASEELAACVAFMIDSPEKAKKMAEKGCNKVEEQYSSKKMAQEYADVYEELFSRQ